MNCTKWVGRLVNVLLAMVLDAMTRQVAHHAGPATEQGKNDIRRVNETI
jgi:hypothetical protein